MKHGDKITLNWLGSDVECEVASISRSYNLSVEVCETEYLNICIVGLDGSFDAHSTIYNENCDQVSMSCTDLVSPQAALDELATRLGYKKPTPAIVDKARCEEESW